MKVYIDKDEWWPVYDVTEASDGSYPPGRECFITPYLWEQYQKAVAEFEAIQATLAKIYDEEHS